MFKEKYKKILIGSYSYVILITIYFSILFLEKIIVFEKITIETIITLFVIIFGYICLVSPIFLIVYLIKMRLYKIKSNEFEYKIGKVEKKKCHESRHSQNYYRIYANNKPFNALNKRSYEKIKENENVYLVYLKPYWYEKTSNYAIKLNA